MMLLQLINKTSIVIITARESSFEHEFLNTIASSLWVITLLISKDLSDAHGKAKPWWSQPARTPTDSPDIVYIKIVIEVLRILF